MKSIKIPFIGNIPDSGIQDIEKVMEEKAAKGYMDCVCWPDSYPYMPEAVFMIARDSSHITIMYRVRSLDLRSLAQDDNGPVWEDSCCEFFVGDPNDGTYYNFEMNCTGTVLAAKRKSRQEVKHFSGEMLNRIERYATLEKKAFDESGDIHSWMTVIRIPFELIGFDGENIPDRLRANFYKCADGTAHPHFLSWNPVKTEKPDFHRPEFFGELIF